MPSTNSRQSKIKDVKHKEDVKKMHIAEQRFKEQALKELLAH